MYKILVVDDEKNIADGVCYTIEENFGEEVIVNACYGIESAKNFILQNVVDILVCDINMPKQSGLDFCEQLLKDYPSLKIIFLTGYNDFSYTYKALKMPDVSYVLKLENDDVLLNEISKKMQLIANNRKAKRELLVEKAINRALEWELEKLKTGRDRRARNRDRYAYGELDLRAGSRQGCYQGQSDQQRKPDGLRVLVHSAVYPRSRFVIFA